MLNIRASKRLSHGVLTLVLCLTLLSVLTSAILAEPYSADPSQAKSGRTEVAWRHAERALKPVDSTFRINLPYISPGAEWLVGVKPVKAGEKEKMYVGVFTWADDNNKSVRGNGFKRLARMEDYPQELADFGEGYATLNGSISPDETLVIYMEVAPTTQTVFNEDGKERAFNASKGSYLVFDGKFERASIQHTGSLIARANTKKIKKELGKRGLLTGNQKSGPGRGVGVPISWSVAGAPAPAQNCLWDSVEEACAGGECTCWSVTVTCGGSSCTSAGGSCPPSDGVSISWTIDTSCGPAN